MFWAILILVVSLIAVVKAADWFLSSAERVGLALKLSPFLLGMILVGFGTSLPELATSLAAVIDGNSNVTLANIIGSNLMNILVIVGIVSFTLGTIHFEKDLIDLDLPLLFGATAVFGFAVADGNLDRSESVLLLIGFVGYLLYALIHREGKEFHKGLVDIIRSIASLSKGSTEPRSGHPLEISWILKMIGSLIILGIASRLSVDNAIFIAEETGFLVDVISFFAIAVGTSLPELLVSLRAVQRGNGDIAIGNIIGSCIFNIMMIGGIAGLLAPQALAPELVAWLLGGLGVSALLISLSGITRRIYAWEGLIYLLVYGVISIKILSFS